MAIINVPSDFTTVQAAINAASDGDTILVQPGVYNESITIDKELTVQAAGSGVILDGNSVNENYYMVTISSSNVTVDGFEITNPIYNGTADASGIITLGDNLTNIRILNNIIHDIGRLDRPLASFGTFGINSGGVDGMLIEGNTIYNIGNADPRIDNGWAIGIFVYGNSSEDPAQNITIRNNVVSNISSLNPINDGINAGGDSGNITITDNNVNQVKRGIVTNPVSFGTLTISSNIVSNASTVGILLRSPAQQIVYGNTITNNNVGISVTATSSAPVIRYNNFIGNRLGLENLSENTVQASNNWWGSATGPIATDTFGNVVTSPFLTAPVPENLDPNSTIYTTGPVITDQTVLSLAVQVENLTGQSHPVIINVYDISTCPKTISQTSTLTVDSQGSAFIKLPRPPVRFEVEIVGMTDNMFAWLGGRNVLPESPFTQGIFVEPNTFVHQELVEVADFPPTDSYTLTTGPVMVNSTARSTIVTVLNNTDTEQVIDVNIYQIRTTPKTLFFNTTFTIQPNCSAVQLFTQPPNRYEIEFVNMSDGVLAWTATRTESVNIPISTTSLNPASVLRHEQLSRIIEAPEI